MKYANVDIVGTKTVRYWGQAMFRASGVVETGHDSRTLSASTASKGAAPNSHRELPRAFLEPITAPEGWFNGIKEVTERVLVTAGELERARDDIEAVGRLIKRGYEGGKSANEVTGVDVKAVTVTGDTERAKTVVQAGGVHDDPIIEHLVGTAPGGREREINTLILEWLADGFSRRDALL